MVSPETLPPAAAVQSISSPRISFSGDFLDENNLFISICPSNRHHEKTNNAKDIRGGEQRDRRSARTAADFEFLSGTSTDMITADELFREGKMLPFWQMQHTHTDKIGKISTSKTHENDVQRPGEAGRRNEHQDDGRRISWFLDDDPSPRPPKCTVLWKELLRLRKHRASTLSPSSSSSLGSEIPTVDERKKSVGSREKVVNRVKKGLERTRSASIRIRPMINVPICTQGKSNSLPPLFPLRRGRLDS